MRDSGDRQEIRELLDRHQLLIDLGDADGYAQLFCPEGAYASPFAAASGRAAIREMFRRIRSSGFTDGKRHMAGPSTVDVQGDRATAFSSWWVADYAGAHPAVFATGTYKDDLEKVGGDWLIARRVQTLDSQPDEKSR